MSGDCIRLAKAQVTPEASCPQPSMAFRLQKPSPKKFPAKRSHPLHATGPENANTCIASLATNPPTHPKRYTKAYSGKKECITQKTDIGFPARLSVRYRAPIAVPARPFLFRTGTFRGDMKQTHILFFQDSSHEMLRLSPLRFTCPSRKMPLSRLSRRIHASPAHVSVSRTMKLPATEKCYKNKTSVNDY